MKSSRKEGDDEHGITPFQAFVTGLASRVGVGNVAGVAIAIAIGSARCGVLDVVYHIFKA